MENQNAVKSFLMGLLGEQPPAQEMPPMSDKPWDDPSLQAPSLGTPTLPPPPGAPMPPPVQPVDEAMSVAETLKQRNQQLAPWAQTGLPR